LSPAYDLISSALVFPKDKDDMALLLSGRKRNIMLKDFENLANSLGLAPKVFQRVLRIFRGSQDKVFELIDLSFLPEGHKVEYKKIWTERSSKLL